MRGRAVGEDASSVGAAARSHVGELVGGGEDVEVVIDDDDRRSVGEQAVEDRDQGADVERMQSGRWLVEDVENVALAASQPGGDAQPLGLAA